ncbi:MAG: S8 family serine peptidase, partial [bacterium]|nr:S8 family serine peptidase [bacterium]
MNLRKSFIFIATMVFIFLAPSLLPGSQYNTYEDLKVDQLKKIAATRGHVPVMVKLDVTGIDDLLEKSRSFKSGISDRSVIQSAVNADCLLEEAISKVADSVLHRLNGKKYKLKHKYATIPYVSMSVSAEALDDLRALPGVLDVREDIRINLPASEIPLDGGVIDKPQLSKSTELVGANLAWGFGITGEGWYVAVIDTGLRTSHQMFQGKHIVEACFSYGSYLEEEGGCPNGLVEMVGPGAAVHDPDLSYIGGSDHGTHVAGIAVGNNGSDHLGVAKGANIIAINVFSYQPDSDGISAYNSDIVKGLEHTLLLRTTHKIAAVNLSLGGGFYSGYCNTDSFTSIIDSLTAVEIAVTVASGNEYGCQSIGAPACVQSAVTVSNTNKADLHDSQGNWHDTVVDLMAPGVNIFSAVGSADDAYGVMSGTSMSAPHVAGAWALMREFNQNLSFTEILASFKETGPAIVSTCQNAAVTKPRLDVGAAIMASMVIAPPLNLDGTQHTNKSLLQIEYINVLSWESNPVNQGKNVTSYRLYTVNDTQLNLLSQFASSVFTYNHRNVGKLETMYYAITAVDDTG